MVCCRRVRAAIVMQQQYRNRVTRHVARLTRKTIQKKKQQESSDMAMRKVHAAVLCQASPPLTHKILTNLPSST